LLFTGLIHKIGRVETLIRKGVSYELTVGIPDVFDWEKGESVAINGVCTTVEWFEKSKIRVILTDETIARSNLDRLVRNSKVNIERSLRLDSRLGGHIVQGHVDCVGKVKWLKVKGDTAELAVSFQQNYAKFIVEKGSIALDGVSLTISKLNSGFFCCALIPETIKSTIISNYKPGTSVNLEFDIIAKYIKRMLKNK